MPEIENFDEYFFDIRKFKPQKGQVIACYSAVAYLEDGADKRQLVSLLMQEDKAVAATAVMRNLFLASQEDSFRIPREIAEDLCVMDEDAVGRKPYKYTVQMHFYALPEHIPVDDPHWSMITLVNMESFVNDTMSIKGRLLSPDKTETVSEIKEI